MCGIAGFIRTEKNRFLLNTEAVLRNLAYYNRLRGVDAFGAFKVKAMNKDYEILRDVGDPYKLLNTDDEYKAFFNNPGEYKYFVMHNRHATRGQNSVENAHPYMVNKTNGKGFITLVHNGTITHNSMDAKYPGKTDSMSLTKMIADGVSLTELESAVWGAYALAWYDSEDDSLHFVRNKERPFGFVVSNESIWFGSEVYAVAAAMERNNTKVKDIEYLPINQEWVWYFEGKEFAKNSFPLKPRGTSGSSKSWGPNYTNPQSKFYDEFDPWDSCDAEFVLTKQESPKSTSNGNVSSAGTGATAVEIPPFAKNDFGGMGTSSKPYKNYGKRAVEKPRYRSIEGPAVGYAIGDYVCFSLTDFSVTQRATQVRLDGEAICFRSDSGMELIPNVNVKGMVAMNIEDVDATDCVWQGTLTHIARTLSKEGEPFKYIFSLRDVEPKKEVFDPFRSAILAAMANSNPLKPKVDDQWLKDLKKVCDKVDKKRAEEEGKTTTTASEDTSPQLRSCVACSKVTDTFHEVGAARLNEDSKRVNISFCRECFVGAIVDPDLMWHFIDKARGEAEGEVINQQTGVINHHQLVQPEASHTVH